MIFLGGLPRSCSTLLTALIAQNAKVSVTGTSPLPHLVQALIKERAHQDFKSMNKAELDARMLRAIRGTIDGWHNNTETTYSLDKSRGWVNHIDLLTELYGDNFKMIIPIRDIRGILSSSEKLYRKNPATFTPGNNTTIQHRINNLLEDSHISSSIEQLFEIVQRGLLDKCLIVRAEDLVSNPGATMTSIWCYLGIDQSEIVHNFNNIVNPSFENDVVYEPYGEHTIASSIKQLKTDWDEILTQPVAKDIKNRTQWFYDIFYPDC